MRRAMTLLELLLAISVLSMMAGAIASWIAATARSSARFDQPLRWQAAAERTLQLIQDDLKIGDLLPKEKVAGGPSEGRRVGLEDDKLVILTRDGGAARHRYVYDVLNQSVSLLIARRDGESKTRVLLGKVQEFTTTIDETKFVLTVAIRAEDGTEFIRRYGL